MIVTKLRFSTVHVAYFLMFVPFELSTFWSTFGAEAMYVNYLNV